MKVAVPMGYKTPTNQMHLFLLQKSLEPKKTRSRNKKLGLEVILWINQPDNDRFENGNYSEN